MEGMKLASCQPSCALAHDLINRLSVIVGYCDLLAEATAEDCERQKRVLLIGEIARSAAKQLGGHKCKLELLARPAGVSESLRLSRES
jgi:hypothetical protein